jgi:hypothetical protein
MFDQPVYFSESQQQLIHVEDMPLPYARNVLNKLSDEEGFDGSVLQDALYAHLMPSPDELIVLLLDNGAASFYCPPHAKENTIRTIFYRVGKRIHKRILTHKNGDFIEGRINVSAKVTSHT